jgi:reactive intermediate/imine deaminase
MARKVIQPNQMKKPAAPYSLAVLDNRICFVSGIVATDGSGQLVGHGDIRAQTRQVLENISQLLREAGGDLRHVGKTTVFLTDFANYAGMNEVYAEFFPSDPPARATVRADLVHRDFLVEIEAFAVIE